MLAFPPCPPFPPACTRTYFHALQTTSNFIPRNLEGVKHMCQDVEGREGDRAERESRNIVKFFFDACTLKFLRRILTPRVQFSKILISYDFLVYFGLVSWRTASERSITLEETPPTTQNCSTRKGARREPWQRSRNETPK